MATASRSVTVRIVVLVTLAALLAACSSSGDDGGSSSNAAGGSTTTTVPCSGKPLKLMSILSLTGPLSVESSAAGTEDGTKVAVDAVNGTCQLGRPLQIDICDDKSSPNGATKCGREAASNGTLALFGSTGSFDTGTTAANLPGVMGAGASVFDLTNPRAFAAISALTLVVGGASASAAAGAKKALMVSIDTGITRTFMGTAIDVAKDLGVELDVLWVPPETTDWAPVAAQVSEREPQAIGLALQSVVPLINALKNEGITPEDVPIQTAVTLVPPEQIDELGEKADGIYLVTQVVPGSDTSNPGVKQMIKEFGEAGVDIDPSQSSPAVVTAWSQVHTFADLVGKLPKEQIATLDSDALVDVFETAPPVSRPEYASFDFSKNAYPDIEALAGLRLYSREAMVLRVEDGGYTSVTPFGDATKPFKLEK
jgi:ABC-type branched-subunit amino acid transport system substrate-binding protein